MHLIVADMRTWMQVPGEAGGIGAPGVDVNHLMWMLGAEFRSSLIAMHALNH